MSIPRCCIRPLIAVLLQIVCLVFPIASNAQDISDEGVARSASLFSALISHCQKSYFINVEEAKKYEWAFVNSGTKAFGKAKFSALLAREMKRRQAEVKATGTAQWCAYQKSHIQQIGAVELLEKSAAKFGATADEMAMLLASLLIAQKSCGLQTNDTPLNSAVKKRGFDLKAFLPSGDYASVFEAKMKKAEEFIEQQGSKRGCEGITDTIRKFLPEVMASENNPKPSAK